MNVCSRLQGSNMAACLWKHFRVFAALNRFGLQMVQLADSNWTDGLQMVQLADSLL
jgi:hypothetical protein